MIKGSCSISFVIQRGGGGGSSQGHKDLGEELLRWRRKGILTATNLVLTSKKN